MRRPKKAAAMSDGAHSNLDATENNQSMPGRSRNSSPPTVQNQFGHWEDIAKQQQQHSGSKSPEFKNQFSASSARQQERNGPFSHPVYMQLSRINGDINKMKDHELIARLKSLKLDTRGSITVLRKRLKAFYKQQKLHQHSLPEKQCKQHYDYICIIDFEATCEAKQGADYVHEIIEFPAVLVDTGAKRIVDEFHEYCSPTVNKELSEFCTELTGITQDQVNKADKFPGVLERFQKWLASHSLGIAKSFVVMTDGPWDMGKFLFMQCQINQIPFPSFGKKWVNIRKTYSNFYDTRRHPLAAMLELLGLQFEGQQHSGIDDARNIARIAIRMLKDGAVFRVNERLHWNDLLRKEKEVVTNPSVVPVSSKEFYMEVEKVASSKGNAQAKQKTEAAANELAHYIESLGIDPATLGEEAKLLAHRTSSTD